MLKRNVQYETVSVAYLDILGFQELVATRSANEISRTLRILKEHSNPVRFRGLFVPVTFEYTVNFSDLCIISVPFEKNEGRMGGALWSLVVRLLQAQVSLIMRHKILVRGGVTVGRMTRSYRQLFGPAIIRSYQLERAAKMPRIVVDPIIFEEIENTPALWLKSKDTESSTIRDLLTQDDENDLFYVDYLRHSHDEPSKDEPGRTLLDIHHSLVEVGLAKQTDPGVREKYEWLRRYHARTVSIIDPLRAGE